MLNISTNTNYSDIRDYHPGYGETRRASRNIVHRKCVIEAGIRLIWR